MSTFEYVESYVDSTDDWTDEMFLSGFFNGNKFKSIDSNLWRRHIVAFLNACYSNSVHGYDLKSNLSALILMLPHPFKHQLLFHDYFNENSLCVKDIESTDKLYEYVLYKDSPKEFLSYVARLLDEPDLRKIRIIVGTMALACFTKVDKTGESVKTFISKELLRIMRNSYPHIDYFEEIPVPTDVFFNHLKIDKDDREIARMLIFVLGTYASELKKPDIADVDFSLTVILEANLLNEIRLTGMKLIYLIERICQKYRVDFLEVSELFFPLKMPSEKEPCEEMDDDLKALFEKTKAKRFEWQKMERMNTSEFYMKYVTRDSKVITWPWARLISDNYFKQFSLRHLDSKTIIIANTIALFDPDVWNMNELEAFAVYRKPEDKVLAAEYDTMLRKLKKVWL